MSNFDDLQPSSEGDERLSDITYRRGLNKLDSHNWLEDIPANCNDNRVAEVRFKNTRKGFYLNINDLKLETGDLVAVEASPGHDIGRVSMTGHLVSEVMRKLPSPPPTDELRKIYRKARPVDIAKWEEAKSRETPTMLRSRQIANDLGLDMKIGDVEFQGDNTKATFYYIADERVDFRKLIRVMADEFRIRIEMRQIGARQEAGRIGGIGSCGRELCCATHISCFMSVTTADARDQDISLNPQKLAGQCSKLKCCLSYERDCYIDAQKEFPPKEVPLHTRESVYYFQKMEVYKRLYWYSQERNSLVNMTAISVERVEELQRLNKRGVKPRQLLVIEEAKISDTPVADKEPQMNSDSITRFDKEKGSGKKGIRPKGNQRSKKRRGDGKRRKGN